MDRIPWQENEIEILKKMAAAGRRVREISAVLKSRSSNSINCKAYSLGLSLGEGEPEIDMDEFKRLMGGR